MRILLYLIVFLLLCAPAFAIGLAHEHLEDRTLKLAPGQNYFFKLTIQNNEEEDILINVTLESEIATLVGGDFLEIPAKTYDSFVYFDIQVPADAQQGATYPIRYVVMPTERGEGQVPFTVKYDRTMTILVEGESIPIAPEAVREPADIAFVQQPKSNNMNYLYFVLILIPIAAFLVFLWQRSDLLAKRIKRQKSFKHGMKPKVAPPEKHFRFPDGKKIASAPELLDTLRHMDEQTFKHHVTEHKNDFSHWLETALDAPAMAKRLAAESTRKGMIRVLERALH